MEVLPIEILTHIFFYCNKESLISCTMVDKVMNSCIKRIDIALHIINNEMNTIIYTDKGKKYPKSILPKTYCEYIMHKKELKCTTHNTIILKDKLSIVINRISTISGINEEILKKSYKPWIINDDIKYSNDEESQLYYTVSHLIPKKLVFLDKV